ncbi:hypothetical protein U8V72_23695 [Priestia filamentosa]|uniref:hypothetical protein n=1 Tax=Priestia filamentosa TaxID=1402861 RepID=UPI0005895115
MERKLKNGDVIVVEGKTEYEIITIYLDQRAWNGYSEMVGLYHKEYKEVIAAMPVKNIKEYFEKFEMDWEFKQSAPKKVRDLKIENLF